MSAQKINQIRKLYETTTASTVERDLKRAVEILKTLRDEETRERAAVFMDGLSQMRSEWRLEKQRKARRSSGGGRKKTPTPRRSRKTTRRG